MKDRYLTRWDPYRNKWVVVDLEDNEKVLMITDWKSDAVDQMVALETVHDSDDAPFGTPDHGGQTA